MHELSIALSILDSVQEEVEKNGYSCVEAVHLRIGAMSGIVPDALRSAYELASEQTPFAHSRLVIEELPIVIFCSTCKRTQPVQSVQMLYCSECNSPAGEIISGSELEIRALEVSV